MIYAFGLRIQVVFFAAFAAAGILLSLVCFGWPDGLLSVFTTAFQGAGIGSLLLLVASSSKCVDRLWCILPVLNQWVAPNMNGVYSMITTSNLPLKNGDVDGSMKTVRGRLSIKMGLLNISIHYEPTGEGENRSTSHVPVAGLKRPTNGERRFQLYYIFEGEVMDGAARCDEDRYLGSARLLLDPESRTKASGIYWTNRAWRSGLNTAGRLEITKIN